MTSSTMRADCLCGAITINAIPSEKLGACHCSTCRTWGGGPLMTTEAQNVEIEGLEQLGVFESSDWAERGFCKQCGTHLFYRLKVQPIYHLPAGLFQDVDYEFDHQVFIDQRPPYYAFANKTKELTGEELFAMFGAE